MASAFFSFARSSKKAKQGQGRPSTSRKPSSDQKDSEHFESLRRKEARRVNSLNGALQTLTEIFPEVQPEVFREMLSTFSEESRLQVVTEALIKSDTKYVRGRYRMPKENETVAMHKYKYKTIKPEDSRGRPLAAEERFRSEDYKSAVCTALSQEFKGLKQSTIQGVLAEYNDCYTQARPTLMALASKSWRYSLTSLLFRRKAPSAKNHPLVEWKPDRSFGDAEVPSLISTSNDELDEELFQTLIVPELQKLTTLRETTDFDLAEQLNEKLAEELDELYECQCCFIPRTVEQLTACDAESHFLCHACVLATIKEVVYGQGWARSVDSERGTLRCVAPGSGNRGECKGCVPQQSLRIAMSLTPESKQHFRDFESRIAADSIRRSGLSLISCPFCDYAEADPLALTDNEHQFPAALDVKPKPLRYYLQTKRYPAIQQILFLLARPLLQLLLFPYILLLQLFSGTAIHHTLARPLSTLALRRRGLRFRCPSPRCQRASCLRCRAAWHDPHACFSAPLTSLRHAVDAALADAVKRTCPRCHLSFVKSAGCNKLVCVCGYAMCYVCRANIPQREGYAHFCQHFRPAGDGGQCRECDRCDLYRVEEEDAVLERARAEAEREWAERMLGGGSGSSGGSIGQGGEAMGGEGVKEVLMRAERERLKEKNSWGWDGFEEGLVYWLDLILE